MEKRGQKIFSLLASILETPSHRTIEQVRASIDVVGLVNREAGIHLEQFSNFCATNPIEHLENIYSRTFALDSACSPYVAHQLFLDERSRLLFQSKLKEYYNSRLNSRNDRNDHIAALLRSLILQESVEEARELIHYCLVPALRKMIGTIQESSNPYHDVLLAVLLTLETAVKAPSKAA